LPHHPSLKEVVDDCADYEWLDVSINGFSLGDFADSENGIGSISSPSFRLFSGASRSEFGTYSFRNAVIDVELAKDSDLQNLKGEFPLGSINYYDTECVVIVIKISNEIYNHLLQLLLHKVENFCLKIGIPVWKDTTAKCLPLMKYQVSYKENEWALGR